MKWNRLSSSFVFIAVIIILIVVRIIIISNYPIELIQESYFCEQNKCSYSYTLKNISKSTSKGSVRAQFYRGGGIKSSTKTVNDVQLFSIGPQEEQYLKGSVDVNESVSHVKFILYIGDN